MGNFENNLKREIEEVRMLKTGVQKSASSVELVSYNINVSTTLNQSGYGWEYVRVRPVQQQDMLINATLNKINGDDNGRQFETCLFFDGYDYVVYVGFTGNSDDDATIAGGGTVTVSATLTVISTDEFTMEVL